MIKLKINHVFYFTLLLCFSCNNKGVKENNIVQHPSEVIKSLDKWQILLGNGVHSKELIKFKHEDFFYVAYEGKTNWVVYKTPNSGITSKTSSNTRTELGEVKRWTPEEGGSLSGNLKVMHVSTTGDARVAASYSVVVGQIHSDEGHENEPLKIFFKKFPGHKKGSVFWNYEINTKGTNSQRWDYSTAVWGYDISTIGTSPNTYPPEPENGIELGEEFSYKVNVNEGIMYLSFSREGRETVTFEKNLIKSEFSTRENFPYQITTLYAPIGRDGLERKNGYAGEAQFFKQGAYNQSNGKNPEENIVWNTGSKIYEGDIAKQYENGSYTEVWFKESTIGPSKSLKK